MEKNMQYYVKISNEVMLKNVHRRKALTKDLVENIYLLANIIYVL